MSDFDLLSAAGPLAPWLVDPNSTLGLRWEGAQARTAGREAATNPYSKSHPGSLAELYWWEGWWLEGQRASGARKPDMEAAKQFAKAQRAPAELSQRVAP